MLGKSSEWVLKAILNRCPADKRESLELYLPSKEQQLLQTMPSVLTSSESTEEEPLLNRVHWSWLLPPIKAYAAEEGILFLYALPVHIREKLNLKLKFQLEENKNIPLIAKNFFKQRLVQGLVGSENILLPIEFLPLSPLTPLLHLSKDQLVRLINFLSLDDLASECKQIVETKILKKIYSFLSDQEKELLKKALHRKSLYTSKLRLLEHWDNQEQSFRIALHKRGLARLSAALASQPEDFAWYVCHQLDIGRGTTLLKLSKQQSSAKICTAMIQQVSELLQAKEHIL